MSREHCWDMASKLTADMFDVAAGAGLEIMLVYFRGLDEVKASPWLSSAPALRALMERIGCRSGHTKIAASLRFVHAEHTRKPIACTVLISDSCEELPADIYLELQDGRCPPVFAFQEGDADSVGCIYKQIAELSHGAYGAFNAGAAQQLAELLRGVAAYASGGIAALEHQGTKGAQLLL